MRPSRYDRGPVLFRVSDRTFVWYGNCTFVSICNISLLFLLKMSDVDELELEPGETVEGRIASCQAVLKRPAITDKDKRYVQQMLNKAIAIKKKKQGRTMSSILTKYGVPTESEEIIDVDGSPQQPATKPTTRKKKAAETPKSPPPTVKRLGQTPHHLKSLPEEK